jgi:hypothetical protein
MSKIYVRERTHIGRGAGRPRFVIVAVEGTELKFYAPHIRKSELDALATDLSLQVVYLPRGEKADQDDVREGNGKGRRRRQHTLD